MAALLVAGIGRTGEGARLFDDTSLRAQLKHWVSEFSDGGHPDQD